MISTGAMRLESTSLGFVDETYPAIAHHEVVLALITAATGRKAPFHVGITATAAGSTGGRDARWPGSSRGFPTFPRGSRDRV